MGFTIRTGSLEEALDFASGARLERPVSSDVIHHFPVPLEIIGPADIRLQVSDVTDSGSRCEGSFTMLLRKNAS